MGGSLFDYLVYFVLPFLGWLGNIGFRRLKKKKEGNELAKDTVELNSDLIGTNDKLLSKIGELQDILAGIKEESGNLKMEILKLKGMLNEERIKMEQLVSENENLSGIVEKMEAENNDLKSKIDELGKLFKK